MEIWRTVALRTLSVFENQQRVQDVPVEITLKKAKTEKPTYQLERCPDTPGKCAICDTPLIRSSLLTQCGVFTTTHPAQASIKCKECKEVTHKHCVKAMQI